MSTIKKRKCNGCKDMDYTNEDGFCPACADNGGRVNKDCGRADCDDIVKKGEKSIKCERCRRWFHMRCSGLSSEEFNAISKVRSAMWFCTTCKETVVISLDCFEEIKKENKKLRQEMEELKKNITEMKDDIVREVKQSLSCNIIDSIKDKVLQELKEKEEKERRSKNIVIYGVVEPSAETPQAREREDVNMCCNIIEIGAQVTDYEIICTKRLGKWDASGAKVRPVLVELRDSRVKGNIVKNAKNLKHAGREYKKIYIVPDQTKTEREKNKLLREQLKEKREKGETGWSIIRGELRQMSQISSA